MLRLNLPVFVLLAIAGQSLASLNEESESSDLDDAMQRFPIVNQEHSVFGENRWNDENDDEQRLVDDQRGQRGSIRLGQYNHRGASSKTRYRRSQGCQFNVDRCRAYCGGVGHCGGFLGVSCKCGAHHVDDVDGGYGYYHG